MQKIINNVVGGRYYVLEQVGAGGFSKVYRVKDLKSGKEFALKEYVTSDPANQKKLLEGMERELDVLKHTSHPVLPKIFDLIKEDGSFYLVMELVEGVNLKSYIAEHSRFSKKEMKKIMLQILSGLYYLHSLEPPIIYRDLKPANIILKADGTIKLIDFGIAKRYRNDIDLDALAIGSRGFAAPEQYEKSDQESFFNTDIRTDIYGVGKTMFYLRTGKNYQGKFPIFVRGNERKVIKKCIAKNPEHRYQDCIALLCEIKRF